MSCPINYCSNDSFLSTTQILGRPFFDFVAKRDEPLVRSWIDAVKGWGVNERGQPSDGGFGFGKFHLFVRGRDSVYAEFLFFFLLVDLTTADSVHLDRSERMEPEPPQPQPRHGRPGARSSAGGPQPHTSRAPVAHTAAPMPARSRQPRSRPAANIVEDEIVVDAIFSAHSDGLMVILRHASNPSGGAQPAKLAPTAVTGPSKLRQSTASSPKSSST